MKPSKITPVVVNYMVQNYKELKGTMPFKFHFLVRGKSSTEWFRDGSKIYTGVIVDVIADMIEKEKFFGYNVFEAAYQAANPNNAHITPIKVGDYVEAPFRVKLIENGMISLSPEIIKPKNYLNFLKDPRKFKQSASELHTGCDLEKIASIIYFR